MKNIWNCDHIDTEIRTKKNESGNPMVGRMCMRCGRLSGTWLGREHWRNSVGPWDDSISKQWFHTRAELTRKARDDEGELAFKTEKNARHAAELRDKWWREYGGYLKSETWMRKRELVMQRSNGICEGCRSASAVQVHHLTYARAGGNEMLFDLVAICESCHDKIHGKQ